jgi:hypothetical protein
VASSIRIYFLGGLGEIGDSLRNAVLTANLAAKGQDISSPALKNEVQALVVIVPHLHGNHCKPLQTSNHFHLIYILSVISPKTGVDWHIDPSPSHDSLRSGLFIP